MAIPIRARVMEPEGEMKYSKVIFWDFDETLAWRDAKWTGTLMDILGEKSIEGPAYEEMRILLRDIYPWEHPELPHSSLMKGNTWWQYMNEGIASVLVRLGLDPGEAGEVSSMFRGEYLRPDKWRVYDDTVPALVESRRKGYGNIILSNHVPELAELVEGMNITGLVDAVFTSGTIGHEKPSKEIFHYALAQAGMPAGAVMVGDNFSSDITGAMKAGIPAILVRKPNVFRYPHYSATLGPVPSMVGRMI